MGQINSSSFRADLERVCGPASDIVSGSPSWDTACCTPDQLSTLSDSLQQAESLIALCPACKTNFRRFYCAFTCSPDQSLFVSIAQTQNLSAHQAAFPPTWNLNDDLETAGSGLAVKTVDFHVDERFGAGFFDSCKNVKFGATNGLAMDFLGGGARNWLAFLRYMGTERPGLGSPFQIDFPQDDVAPSIDPLNLAPLNCSSADLDARCACADCPDNCLALPDRPSPEEERQQRCHVGAISCLSFAVIILYSLILVGLCLGIGINTLWDNRANLLAQLRHPTVSNPFTLQRNTSDSDYDRVPLNEGMNEDSPRSKNTALNSGPPSASSSVRSRTQPPSSSSSGNKSSRPPSGSSGVASSPEFSLRRGGLGRGAAVLTQDPLSAYQPRTYWLNEIISQTFYKIGLVCASYPHLTIAIGLAIAGLLNAGWANFQIERDPVKLWVAKNSATAIEKDLFERDFGPFYKTEQIFLTDKNENVPVLTWDRLQWWSTVEERIRAVKTEPNGSLATLCFAPTATDPAHQNADDCVIQSFTGYLPPKQRGLDESNWADRLDECATSPASCLPPSGQPLNPRLLFGGIPGYSGERGADRDENEDVPAHEARALVITYVMQNSLDKQRLYDIEVWEWFLQHLLADVAKEADEKGLKMSYSTGISLEAELNKSTNTDIPIVVLSYLLMFLYVSLNLGGSSIRLFFQLVARSFKKDFAHVQARISARRGPIALPAEESQADEKDLQWQDIFVESKFLLGLFGIAIVLLSVSTSVGVFSAMGVKVTLIIAEVIPFLVLAVGVDNVFILSHEVSKQNAKAADRIGLATNEDGEGAFESLAPAEERVAKALSRMGPSILLSASCEVVAFALGSLVGMPAVRNFAIYAAGAVAINALLQITVFVAAIAIDLKRTEANRVDCVPFLQAGNVKPAQRYRDTHRSGLTQLVHEYAEALLKPAVKAGVLVLFSALFIASYVTSQNVQLGLDQRLALPSDSYLVDYFNALDNWLDVGPPVYFVAQDLPIQFREQQESVCGRFSACHDRSLANLLEAERKRSKSSFLSEPPAVWLDDFFQWLNPALEDCCRVRSRDKTQFCSPSDSDLDCEPCFASREDEWNITMQGLPQGEEFHQYLEQWLKSPTDESCPLGGKAPYSTAVALDDTGVTASHFRTYHTPLKTQNDFIDALAAARRISRELTEATGAYVYAYSLPYVFFDQYEGIHITTRQVIFVSLVAIMLIASLLLGSWRTGAVLTGVVFMSTVNVMGVMAIWGVSLNALSLVNLVISMGISVEFSAHIARAFMGANGGGLPHGHPAGAKERDERVWTALTDVGPSVFSGITLTKLIGIIVMAFTRSKLLRIYYFRMWLALIISGALHGLVFLPVALSLYGGHGYVLDRDDDLFGEINERYEEANPLIRDDDSQASV
ncbi:uncharacterized protein L969DRAFT_82820 [Mixia osmundae IAM 14324]|uniref:uncharacterized protein n=1 Tax=Mixia osmundae (strain CBS 9802 / IAM 14324 / JCM 22182 / KY 12970) TaxID=764103 RepID=UPI0004A547AF|nr:uncharacterized protein L969DRAFT_82820 [Mixia osmundae IAM 14324]KEI37934.1 hypothetical protein L969DRAFT_82820 [Mixia osmundae IAM 14324]